MGEVKKEGSAATSIKARDLFQFDENGTVRVLNCPSSASGNDVPTVDWVRSNYVGYQFEVNMWMGSRDNIPIGFVVMDGQQLSETMFPSIRTDLSTNKISAVDETDWQSDPLKRGQWSLGDTGWVRVPDWNGVQDQSIGGLYFAGDQNTKTGTVVNDAIRNISGKVLTTVGSTGVFEDYNITGPFSANKATYSSSYALLDNIQQDVKTPTYPRDITFDVSAVVPTAPENRPKTVYGTWIIRVYGGINNPETLAAASVVTQVTNNTNSVNTLTTQVEKLETRQLALGEGQAFQEVTNSRAVSVEYTNTDAQSIYLVLNANITSADAVLSIYVNDLLVTTAQVISTTTIAAAAVIPANARYKFVTQEVVNVKVFELRAPLPNA